MLFLNWLSENLCELWAYWWNHVKVITMGIQAQRIVWSCGPFQYRPQRRFLYGFQRMPCWRKVASSRLEFDFQPCRNTWTCQELQSHSQVPSKTRDEKSPCCGGYWEDWKIRTLQPPFHRAIGKNTDTGNYKYICSLHNWLWMNYKELAFKGE